MEGARNLIGQTDQLKVAVKLATRNAMSPGLWLGALIGIPCITGAIVAGGWIAVWLLALLTMICLSILGVFVLHSVKNPALLQSEDYLLRRDAMTIYGSSSYKGPEVAFIVDGQKQLVAKEGNVHE